VTRPRRLHRVAAGAPAPGSARVVQQHVLTLPATAASVALARRTAQTVLLRWGMPTSSTVDAALLITSELVANTVRHAVRARELDLTLSLEPHWLAVAVHDDDPRLPPWPPIAQPSAPSGLRVLANLVHECGGHLDLRPNFTGPGKTIHAALPRTPD
jgi:hypothetical protein